MASYGKAKESVQRGTKPKTKDEVETGTLGGAGTMGAGVKVHHTIHVTGGPHQMMHTVDADGGHHIQIHLGEGAIFSHDVVAAEGHDGPEIDA
jgi:hypothetical protein